MCEFSCSRPLSALVPSCHSSMVVARGKWYLPEGLTKSSLCPRDSNDPRCLPRSTFGPFSYKIYRIVVLCLVLPESRLLVSRSMIKLQSSHGLRPPQIRARVFLNY
uniref:Uncharacterized protein n=1 Tax=Schistocephalus solidus TaxID=70667 RepID=A0A0X3NYA6_SCHSO